MKRIALISVGAVVTLLLSLFPTWNFADSIAIPAPFNPLWTDHNQTISCSLTDESKQQGYVFQTGRGAEADPQGICFGRFESDEYWVIKYHADRKEVDAYAWIIGINWIGYHAAASRFSQLKETLQKHMQ